VPKYHVLNFAIALAKIANLLVVQKSSQNFACCFLASVGTCFDFQVQKTCPFESHLDHVSGSKFPLEHEASGLILFQNEKL
jgi:hypothetical protein